ncbi:MAG: hypothetical protein IJM82_01145 [Synergistaceae bacterium]|nr:hypothetical protein [Synergistaceae bacterium]MBQ6435221.1 hypothetical protein [Synergistaceae bacterium]MBQ7067752.1 hypothetical protein [Synergistaceae bacterium]MBR0079322.1 hypothetical protein [Synergistaceae bacterium]MBR0233953.1 hypothetical protein [Synergistaceae bacterium]
MIKTLTTGKNALEKELPLLTEDEFTKLAEYARFLRWSRIDIDDEDDDWADAPLTPEEEEGLRQGRENFKNGNYLTLQEFRERMACGE